MPNSCYVNTDTFHVFINISLILLYQINFGINFEKIELMSNHIIIMVEMLMIFHT